VCCAGAAAAVRSTARSITSGPPRAVAPL
jgi:hypothetical protein